MAKKWYAHPEFLAETQWLQEHLEDLDLRVVDADESPAYQRAHIPGAVRIPGHHYVKDPTVPGPGGYGVHVMKPEQVAPLMESMGIGDDTLVVAYDHSRGLYAGRFWWVLNYYGHRQVKVLNGGWRKWFREGLLVTEAEPPIPPGVKFTPRPDPSLIVPTEELKEQYDRVGVAVWDVRSRKEYTGESPRGNQRVGHIPGAIHLEWLDTVNEADHTLKPAQELRRMFRERGITPEKEVFAH